MVEDRVTDGKRIAQLLASELTGLSTGPLARADVVDADPDAEPSADGSFAYGIRWDGDRVGEVFVHETGARIDLSVGGVDAVSAGNADAVTDADAVGSDGLSVTTTDEGSVRVRVEYAAAVKRAVDLLVDVFAER